MNEIVDLLQEFLMGLLVLVLPVVSVFVVKALKALADKWIVEMEQKKPQLASAIKVAVNLGVKAAEGLKIGGFIEDKKAHALEVAQNWLNQEGWDEVDVAILLNAIEAEVLSVFNSDKAPMSDEHWNAF